MSAARGCFAEVLDALQRVGPVVAKPMFGGLGLYQDGVFFALVFRDRLYFRVDEKSRGEFEARGAEPFRPPRGKSSLSYYEVPADVLEDARLLEAWAERALDAARAIPRKPRGERPAALLNLGPVSRRWLAEVGIRTRADLERVGSVRAFGRVRAKEGRASVLLLYALEGALLGLRWDRLPDEVKRNLRERAGIPEPRPRKASTRTRRR